jgi:hypothetical protein
LTSLDHTIREGNRVISGPAVQPKAFDWQAAFPELASTAEMEPAARRAQETWRGNAATEIKPALTQRRSGRGETQRRRTFSFFLLCVPQRNSAALR